MMQFFKGVWGYCNEKPKNQFKETVCSETSAAYLVMYM